MHIQLRVHIEWFSWIARQTPVYMYIVYRHACAGVCVCVDAPCFLGKKKLKD